VCASSPAVARVRHREAAATDPVDARADLYGLAEEDRRAIVDLDARQDQWQLAHIGQADRELEGLCEVANARLLDV